MSAHPTPSATESAIYREAVALLNRRANPPPAPGAKPAPQGPPDLDAIFKKIRFTAALFVVVFVGTVVAVLQQMPESPLSTAAASKSATLSWSEAITIAVVVVVFFIWKFLRHSSRRLHKTPESTSPTKSTPGKPRAKRPGGEIPDLKDDPGYDAVNYFGKDDPDVRLR